MKVLEITQKNWTDIGLNVIVNQMPPAEFGPAWRAGLRNGDVIVAVGDTKVTKVRDVNGFFETFEFKGFVDFTVHRPTGEGQHEERQFTVRWEAPKSGRVDAKWNKSEKIMNVSVRDVASFTLLFNEEMLKPGEPFHLMINGVPYGDRTLSRPVFMQGAQKNCLILSGMTGKQRHSGNSFFEEKPTIRTWLKQCCLILHIMLFYLLSAKNKNIFKGN